MSPSMRYKLTRLGSPFFQKVRSPPRTHHIHILLKLPANGDRNPTQSRAAFLFGMAGRGGRAEGGACGIETIAGAETC